MANNSNRSAVPQALLQRPPSSDRQGGGAHTNPALRLCSIILLALIILVGLTVLIIWLAIHPRHVNISIHDVYVHDYNLTRNHLNATFDLTLKSKNPNRHVSFYYDSAELSVIYDDQILALGTIPPFHQPRRNLTVVYVKPVARDVPLHSTVSRNLRIERTAGTVELEVHVKAKVRFKVGVWKSNHRKVKITCAPVLGVFIHARSFEETKCKVDI